MSRNDRQSSWVTRAAAVCMAGMVVLLAFAAVTPGLHRLAHVHEAATGGVQHADHAGHSHAPAHAPDHSQASCAICLYAHGMLGDALPVPTLIALPSIELTIHLPEFQQQTSACHTGVHSGRSPPQFS